MGSAEWEPRANLVHSVIWHPFFGGSHPVSALRELRWWDKSEPHGEWSAVHKAVVGG